MVSFFVLRMIAGQGRFRMAKKEGGKMQKKYSVVRMTVAGEDRNIIPEVSVFPSKEDAIGGMKNAIQDYFPEVKIPEEFTIAAFEPVNAAICEAVKARGIVPISWPSLDISKVSDIAFVIDYWGDNDCDEPESGKCLSWAVVPVTE